MLGHPGGGRWGPSWDLGLGGESAQQLGVRLERWRIEGLWLLGWGSGQCLGGRQSVGLGPFPGTEAPTSRDHSKYHFNSASSSAAERPPPVPRDPEPGAFPQEAPLDTLPGELTTFEDYLGGCQQDSEDRESFLTDMGAAQSSSRSGPVVFGGPGHCTCLHPASPYLPPIFLPSQPLFGFCS